MVVLSLKSLGNFILFSTMAAHQFAFPSTVYKGFLFSTPHMCDLLLFGDGHPHRCEMTSHMLLHFPDDECVLLNIFQVSFGHFYGFFGEMFVQILCQVFNEIIGFPTIEL
jgi:hypothetical protein